MARFTLRLPDSLHRQVVEMAEVEGVSMNQYIIYVLTRQMSGTDYQVRLRPAAERATDGPALEALLDKLQEQPTAQEMQKFLQQNRPETPQSESELMRA